MGFFKCKFNRNVAYCIRSGFDLQVLLVQFFKNDIVILEDIDGDYWKYNNNDKFTNFYIDSGIVSVCEDNKNIPIKPLIIDITKLKALTMYMLYQINPGFVVKEFNLTVKTPDNDELYRGPAFINQYGTKYLIVLDGIDPYNSTPLKKDSHFVVTKTKMDLFIFIVLNGIFYIIDNYTVSNNELTVTINKVV